MSERSSEFRDSDVVRNEPLASDIEGEKKVGCFKSKLFKIIIIITISTIIIGLTVFLIFYFLKNDDSKNREEQEEEDEEEEEHEEEDKEEEHEEESEDKSEYKTISATYYINKTSDYIVLFNKDLLDSIYSIEIDGNEYKDINSIYFENEGENTININIKRGTEFLEYMFEGCNNLINVDFTGIQKEKIKSISGMFSQCNSLISLNININNPYIENMSYLFFNCESLESIVFLNIDTSNVIDMTGMFSECPSLI